MFLPELEYATVNIALNWGLYAQIDTSRRWQGRLLDTLGLGPFKTPSRVVLRTAGLTLEAYDRPDASRPALLIVPAPIKRPYIWDMLPRVSVVQRCLENRLQVYLVHWELPGDVEEEFGLGEYADSLILTCVNAVRAETDRERIFLAGHSLGGTLAAIFSALHPNQLQGLVLLAAPLHFGLDVGAFGPILASLMRAHLTDALPGNVPGSVLDIVSYLADPDAFGWSRCVDWLNSHSDPEALQTHFLVERWTLDEMPLARRLVEEVVECLYRQDRFMRGDLTIRGRRAAPERISAPVLSVAETRSPVAPPESILPFHNSLSNTDKRLIWYQGDSGVALQHVGMLVGKTAHQTLWPQIIRWMHARDAESAALT
ncbi:MAG: alpha/beta fold hydrolase [Chromatiales bacterium]